MTVLPQLGQVALMKDIVADLHFNLWQLNVLVHVKRLHLIWIEYRISADATLWHQPMAFGGVQDLLLVGFMALLAPLGTTARFLFAFFSGKGWIRRWWFAGVVRIFLGLDLKFLYPLFVGFYLLLYLVKRPFQIQNIVANHFWCLVPIEF